MGSSTSNMLVDAPEVLEKLFANAPCLFDCDPMRRRRHHPKKCRILQKQYPRGWGLTFTQRSC